jgi:glycerol uptake facilitator-like aquaporin
LKLTRLDLNYDWLSPVFKGFPVRKAAQYIAAQLTGAFVASLLVYAQYKQQLDAIHGALVAGGAETQALIFTNKGVSRLIPTFKSFVLLY